ncbi:MAG: aminotransferase class IV [Planctomycetales bacterium]|nr:aminotransferase class IV [Planctomycetales bacterium]
MHELSVPVTDRGFLLGLTVAEQLRTFRGRLFRLDQHLGRLARSLEIVGVTLPWSSAELSRQASELVADNYRQLGPDSGGDLGLTIFVTPGEGATTPVPGSTTTSQPFVAMHTRPLAFSTWADLYETGQPLRIVETRQVPTQCWPAELKCRSRMHYYLADREAQAIEPASRALLLDIEGRVMEASTANVVFYFREEGLVCPPLECILPGISVAALQSLAEAGGIPWCHRHVTPEMARAADEVLLCSTSVCVLPVTSIDGKPIGDGKPGPVFAQLLDAWSQEVGLDIAGQALASRDAHKRGTTEAQP